MTPEDFARAYAASFELTRCFLLSRGLRPYRAEELAQAAWSKAWERRGQLRDFGSVAAWVITIALNMLRGEARKAGLFVALEIGMSLHGLLSNNTSMPRLFSPRSAKRIAA